MLRKPLWVWMPGQAEPTMAGTLTHSPSGYSLAYERDFIDSGISIDPVAMRLGPRPISAPHLPGVIADAKPAGYGQCRIPDDHQAATLIPKRSHSALTAPAWFME